MKKTLEMKLLSIALTLIMIFVSYVAMPAKALAEDAERAEMEEQIESFADANDFSQDNTLAYSPLKGELTEVCQGDGSLDTFSGCQCQGDGSLDNLYTVKCDNY